MKKRVLLIAIILIIPSVYANELYPTEILAKPGDQINVWMNTNDANAVYYAAASFGTSPGFRLPDGRTMPLNLDALFFLSFTEQGRQYFHNFNGYLDQNGDGSLQMTVPGNPAYIGLEVYIAFVTVTTQGFGTISNPIKVKIVQEYPHELKGVIGLPYRAIQFASAVDPTTNDVYIMSGARGGEGFYDSFYQLDFDKPLGSQLSAYPQSERHSSGASVFVSSQSKIYYFGGLVQVGQSATPSNRILVFDPRTKVTTQHSTLLPSAVDWIAAVYYLGSGPPGTDRVYLFPTLLNAPYARDIWEFNPNTGQLITHPNARTAETPYGTATFIPSKNRVILCCALPDYRGLVNVLVPSLQSSLLPAMLPSWRLQVASVFDPLTGKVLIIGGQQNSVYLDEILSFNPSTNQVSVVGSLSTGLSGHGAQYISSLNGIIVFGGSSPAFTDSVVFIESIAGGLYRTKKVFNFEDARISGSLVRDQLTDVLYYLGGFVSGGKGLTGRITRVNPRAVFPNYVTDEQETMAPLSDAGSVWDTQQNVAYLFGGLTASGLSTRILKFDPRSIPKVSTLASVLPFTISGSIALWDPESRRAYIFGGRDDLGYSRDTILTFDPLAGQVSVLPIMLPYGNRNMMGFYSPVQRSFFLIGGINAGGRGIVQVDLRTTPISIRELVSPRLTANRYFSLAVYHPNREMAYLFVPYTGGSFQSEVYAFDTRQMTITPVAPISYNWYNTPNGVYDPLIGSIIVFGAYQENPVNVFS